MVHMDVCEENFMKKVTIIDHITEKEIFNKSFKKVFEFFQFRDF